MAIRFYLMPLIGTGRTQEARRPAYLTADLVGQQLYLDYGTEPVCLVRLEVSERQHARLRAYRDVLAAALPLSTPLGDTLAAVRAALDTFHIPSAWLTKAQTWQEVLRTLATLCQVAQYLQRVLPGRLFAVHVTLETPVGSLPVLLQAALQDLMATLAVARHTLPGTTLFGTVLTTLAAHVPGPIYLGTDTFENEG
jgi:hypothetical protein